MFTLFKKAPVEKKIINEDVDSLMKKMYEINSDLSRLIEGVGGSNSFVIRDFVGDVHQKAQGDLNDRKTSNIEIFLDLYNGSKLHNGSRDEILNYMAKKMHEFNFEPKAWHSQAEPLYSEVIDKIDLLKKDVRTSSMKI